MSVDSLASFHYKEIQLSGYINLFDSSESVSSLNDILCLIFIPVLVLISAERLELNESFSLLLPIGLGLSAPQVFLLPAFGFFSIFVLYLFTSSGKYSSNNHEESQDVRPVREAKGLLMILTTIAILAVDFPSIFPREWAKTELYGYSYMDAGVGAVVLMSGMNRRRPQFIQSNALNRLMRFISRSLPCLLLGFSRFFFVSEADYYVSTSEYGVHWNFFITVFIISVFCETFNYILSFISYSYRDYVKLFVAVSFVIIGSTILKVHEEWFFFSPRSPHYFNANREGFVSCFGYISLDLIGDFFGNQLRNAAKFESLILCSSIFVSSYLGYMGLAYSGLEFPCRRAANTSYLLGILASAFWLLSLLFSVDYLYTKRSRSLSLPTLIDGILKNQLAFFLLSNLVTGVINLSIRTLLCQKNIALLTMILYSGLLTLFSKGFRNLRFSI